MNTNTVEGIGDVLVPVRKFRPASGVFRWPKTVVLASASLRDRLPMEQMAATLKDTARIRCRLEHQAWGPASVRIRRVPRGLAPEGYTLRVTAEGVEIEAGTDAGAYYGIQTLREWVRLRGATLPCGQVDDSPDFARRGVYYDCSRGKVPTVDTLRSLIEFLARHKINELQLYIENVFTFRRHPEIGKGFDPFTPEDLLAIQEHAELHHMRFVPSLTSFGHFERILMLPAYRSLAEYPGHHGLPGGTTLCPGNPGSIRLVADMYEEFLPLFHTTDFNACCDETWELGRGRSAPRAEKIGVGRIYLDFLLKLHRLCEKHGKRMNVWADILLKYPETISELPRDLVMLNWDYNPKGERIPQTPRFAEAGLACVVCPGTHGWQSHGSRLQKSMDNTRIFAAEGRRNRVEGLLQTDWGDRGHRNPLGASLHGFVHAAALAWHGTAVDDAKFTDRFARRYLGDRDGRIASILRALGSHEAVTACSLYNTFRWRLDGNGMLQNGVPRSDPAWGDRGDQPAPWEKASAEGAQTVVQNCDRALDDLSGARVADPFLNLALEELRWAAVADRLAARRILAGKQGLTGGTPSGRDRQRLIHDIRTTRQGLEHLWLARNRPSRLKANLRLLDNQRTELERA